MKPVVLVHGTWGRADLWHRPDSPLWAALVERGYQPIEFLWSGLLGGYPHPIINPPSTDHMEGDLALWASEGEKLALFCQVRGLTKPDAIPHSHGLQVLSMAAADGQLFGHVLSLAGPVRKDMQKYREQARPNIERWTQVVDRDGDLVIRQGEAFDGQLGWKLDLSEADLQIDAPGQGHSGLTLDIKAWDALGLWGALR
jgi:hypothetical protein